MSFINVSKFHLSKLAHGPDGLFTNLLKWSVSLPSFHSIADSAARLFTGKMRFLIHTLPTRPLSCPPKGRAIVRSHADIYLFLRLKWIGLHVPGLFCILCEVFIFPSACNKLAWPQACCGNGKKWLMFRQMQWGNGLVCKFRQIPHSTRFTSWLGN